MNVSFEVSLSSKSLDPYRALGHQRKNTSLIAQAMIKMKIFIGAASELNLLTIKIGNIGVALCFE